MKAEVAKLLQEAAETIGIECKVREYSGRGMYGSTTAAIVVDGIGTLCQLIAVAAHDLSENDTLMAAGEDHGLLIDEFAEAVGSLRSDNMDRSAVYY